MYEHDYNVIILTGFVVNPVRKIDPHTYIFTLKAGDEKIPVALAEKDYDLVSEEVAVLLHGAFAEKVKIYVYACIQSDNATGRMRLTAWRIDKCQCPVSEDFNMLRVHGCVCEYIAQPDKADKDFLVLGLLNRGKFTRLAGYVDRSVELKCGKHITLGGYIKADENDENYVYPVFSPDGM